jgi:hypothetical protein
LQIAINQCNQLSTFMTGQDREMELLSNGAAADNRKAQRLKKYSSAPIVLPDFQGRASRQPICHQHFPFSRLPAKEMSPFWRRTFAIKRFVGKVNPGPSNRNQ